MIKKQQFPEPDSSRQPGVPGISPNTGQDLSRGLHMLRSKGKSGFATVLRCMDGVQALFFAEEHQDQIERDTH